MNAVHKRALSFAASHFAISFIIALVCLFYLFGAGLSDAYHPDPPWITALVVALWVLQLSASNVPSGEAGGFMGLGLLMLAFTFLPYLVLLFVCLRISVLSAGRNECRRDTPNGSHVLLWPRDVSSRSTSTVSRTGL